MMKNYKIYTFNYTNSAITIFCGLLLILLSFSAYSQEQPPRPLLVTVHQNLSFGAFIRVNYGGQVTIDPQGSPFYTGDLIEYTGMGYQHYPAIFEITTIPGTLINIAFGPDVTLIGNHGGTMQLHIDKSFPVSPFVNTQGTNTQVRIGGTLTVGNAIDNPAGNYTGTFSITFVQQ